MKTVARDEKRFIQQSFGVQKYIKKILMAQKILKNQGPAIDKNAVNIQFSSKSVVLVKKCIRTKLIPTKNG